MPIVGDHPGDAAQVVTDALSGINYDVHTSPVPDRTVAPPCALVSMAHATEQLGTLGCAEWAFEVRILAIAADPSGTDLYDIAAEVHQALWRAGLASTSEPRTYQQAEHPAGLPALEITCG